MQEIKEILQIIISWPMAVIIVVLMLRRPIRKLVERLIKSDSGKAKVGPVEIELGKIAEEGHQVVDDLSRVSYIMAESRRLELEITYDAFGSRFSSEQRERMQTHIDELKKLTKAAATKANAANARTSAPDLDC